MTHHNASLQIFADGEGSRAVWIAADPGAVVRGLGASCAAGILADNRYRRPSPTEGRGGSQMTAVQGCKEARA